MKLKLYNYKDEQDALIIINKNLEIIDINKEAMNYLELVDHKDIDSKVILSKLNKTLEFYNLIEYISLCFQDKLQLTLKTLDSRKLFLKCHGKNTEKLSIVISKNTSKVLSDFLIGFENNKEEGILFLDEISRELSFSKELLDFFNVEYKEGMSFFTFLLKILRKVKNKNNIIHLLSNKFNKHNEFLGIISLKTGEKIEFVYQKYELDNDFKGILCNFYLVNREILKINYDQASGLLEKDMLLEEMDFLVKSNQDNLDKIALFSINIKSFKNINDLYGIKMGNYVLKKTAKRLKQITRHKDIVGRYSADEFLIMVNDYGKEDILDQIAKRIIDKLSLPINLVNRIIKIEAYIGISRCKSKDIDEMIKKSFSALRHGKKNREIISYYSKELELIDKDRLVFEFELKEAIKKKDFVVYYQKQISTEQNKVTGVEALVRWIHKENGIIPPDRFIPVAEELDLIKDIEAIVLEKSIEETKVLREKFGIKLAINLSNKQFNDEAFFYKVEAYNMDMSFLEIEITESIAIIEFEKSLEMINRYKKLGIGIAIDDFGTGYSSLSHLKNLPIDVIKIDKSFICNLEQSKGDQTLVQAVSLIAETLEIGVIVEGVENEVQLELLKDLGCTQFQGYYFDRPKPIKDLENELEITRGII